MQVDIYNIAPRSSAAYNLEYRDEGDYTAYTDEWGIGWRSPKKDGLYYDMYFWPLAHYDTLRRSKQTTNGRSHRSQSLQGSAPGGLATIEEGRAVVIGSISAGISEMHAWTRGFEEYFTDFYLYPELAEYIMDEVVELKMAFWERPWLKWEMSWMS